jgi:hypothetical protein
LHNLIGFGQSLKQHLVVWRKLQSQSASVPALKKSKVRMLSVVRMMLVLLIYKKPKTLKGIGHSLEQHRVVWRKLQSRSARVPALKTSKVRTCARELIRSKIKDDKTR